MGRSGWAVEAAALQRTLFEDRDLPTGYAAGTDQSRSHDPANTTADDIRLPSSVHDWSVPVTRVPGA